MWVSVGQIEHAESLRRADVKQSSFGVETGRGPVGDSICWRRKEHAINGRLLGRIRNRLTVRSDALRPVHRANHRSGEYVLAVGTIQQEKIAVSVGLRQELARFAV